MADKPIEDLTSVVASTARDIAGESAPSSASSAPMQRLARTKTVRSDGSVTRNFQRHAQLTSNTNISAPNFYVPWLTPSSWQIPNNRKEVYLWAQWWVDNEPKVAAGIEFYTDFPLSGFKLECEYSYVKDYFEKLCKKLNFDKWNPLISQEYHLRGDCFVLASVDCDICHGMNRDPKTGQRCEHEGATWKSLCILNPDMVEVLPGMLDQENDYFYMPTDEMKKIVMEQRPKKVYDSMPKELRESIMKNLPLHFEAECIHHFKRGGQPWQPFGTSILRRLFPTLAYKDKLRQAQWLVAERHIVPIKIVKVGDKDRPATQEDIEAVQDELTALANDPVLTLVTHHAFDFDYVGASGKVLQLTNEYELIDQEIIDGLMLNKAIINGDGPSYSNAQVGLLTMAKRLERFRNEVKHWMEEKIFKQVAKWNGFTARGKRGQEEYIYPTVKWDDLQLRDDTGKLQTMMGAVQAGVISNQSFIEALGLDYDQEVERLRFEQGASYLSSPDLANTDMNSGFSGGGGYGAQMGMAPPMPGMPSPNGAAPMGAPDMGGMPPLAPAASSDWEENYRFAAFTIGDIYDIRLASAEHEKTIRTAGVKIKSAAHRDFLTSLAPVTGRGAVGDLPLEPEGIFEILPTGPADGGPFCQPINRLAMLESIQRDKAGMTRTAAKNEKKMVYRYTNLEQKLYNIVLRCSAPFAFYAQFQAGPGMEYQLDGAFPAIKLGVEADSETFHNSADKIAKDRQRDMRLATQGWTILRFTEEELNEHPQEVMNVIVQAIRRLAGGGPHMGSSVTL